MNRSVWMAVALAATMVTGIAADERKIITVTGCVQNFSAKGTVGTTERGYLLTNAQSIDADAPATASAKGSAPAETPAGTSGAATPRVPPSGTPVPSATEAAGPSSSRASSAYRLEGQEDELKNHVGHKVEVRSPVCRSARSGGCRRPVRRGNGQAGLSDPPLISPA
jgi:hypothetical protein